MPNSARSYPTFKWNWVPYVRVHSLPAHVFTIAGLRSPSEDLDRPIAPSICRRINWGCVRSVCADWLIANVSHTLATDKLSLHRCVFCPNKWRSFEPFMCSDLSLHRSSTSHLRNLLLFSQLTSHVISVTSATIYFEGFVRNPYT